MTLITNSRMKAFQQCQRLHQIKYIDGYRAIATAEVEFGSLMHAGLEAWWGAYQEKGDGAIEAAIAAMNAYASRCESLDNAGQAKADVMMRAYDVRWSGEMADLSVVAVEKQFEAALRTPTGRPAKGLQIAGKLDAIVQRRSTGKYLMVEHKTSGADLTAGSSYWQRLRLDSQVSMYHHGARALGFELSGCLYDVIVRPELRPLKATPDDKKKFTKDGRLYANQRENDETVDEFRARIAAAITEAPDAYFARVDVTRLEGELAASAADVYQVGCQIRNQLRTGIAPRNTGACNGYGRICEFAPICDGSGSLDDDTKFSRVESVHPELQPNKQGERGAQ